MSNENKNRNIENIEIDIIYKADDNNKDKIRLFGEKFVKTNKEKCKIIYKDKEYELTEYLEDIDSQHNYKEEILIKLLMNNNINNISYMFYESKFLSSILDKSKKNYFKITDIKNISSETDSSQTDNTKISYFDNSRSDILNQDIFNENNKNKKSIQKIL